MLKTETNTTKIEEDFLCFLQTEIHTCSLENISFFDKKSSENLTISEKKQIKEELRTHQTKTLIGLIKNIYNQHITDIFIKFLDVSKTYKIYILKIPKCLRESKYKIFFWMLFFCYKNQEDFQSGFHKLIAEISKEYPKKTVFDLLNFGVTLSKIKGEKKWLFIPPISEKSNDKKKSAIHFNYN